MKKWGIGSIIAGGIIGIGMTLGGLTNGAVEIWRKDVSNVVRVFPTDLQINVGTSVFTAGTLTEGGGITATSTSGTVVPLLASNFDVENVIDVTLNVQDATLSFPATSTLTSFIPTAGQKRTLYIRNASTTAAMDLTITGGTGVLLKKATTTAVVYGDTDGANYARIELTRKSNTDIEALLQIFMD